MNAVEKIQMTVHNYAANAQKAAKTVQAEITGAFELGYMIEASQMERLMTAQAETAVWGRMVKLVERAMTNGDLEVRMAERLDEIADYLIEVNGGGSTSLVQNAKDAAERRAHQAAYKALRPFATR